MIKISTIPFYLIRHGEKHANIGPNLIGEQNLNVKSTPKCIKQSIALGKSLNKQGITFYDVFTSTTLRSIKKNNRIVSKCYGL